VNHEEVAYFRYNSESETNKWNISEMNSLLFCEPHWPCCLAVADKVLIVAKLFT
jgi:hypothetical protein